MLYPPYQRLMKRLRYIAGHRNIINDGLAVCKRELIRLVRLVDPRRPVIFNPVDYA